ncbi:VOC family protein [Arthrobacter sp. GCM10027362]|uniref:VOC family protein n=1 Tax=Arthrobacter sp. GCM10027362 TaxID=3273379 RepID=UPI003640371B
MTTEANRKTYSAGATVWQELTASSADGLDGFYRQVLGWDLLLDGDTGVFTLDGVPVAGLRIDPAAGPAEAGWKVFLGTGDVPGAVERAVAAGAVVVQDQVALAGVAGSAVVLREPEGPLFGIASVAPEEASVPSPEPGRLALVDVMSHDLPAATAFQQALFPQNGIEHVEDELSIFRDAQGAPLRGVNAIHEEMKAVLPPHWLAWFVVADQAKAAETALAAGGGVNVQDQPIAFGRWAVVTDPSGAAFKALELDREI